MKKLILAICVLVSLSGVAQTKSGSEVPKELITNDSTYWTISTLSNISYVNTTPGAYYGTTTNGGGMIVHFKFLPNNRYIFQLYVEVNTYNLRNTSWTQIEGSVTFTQDEKGQNIFITKAEKGAYRMSKNGNNTSRPVTTEELKNQHSGRYLWEKTKLKDDPNNIYLLMVDLKAHPDADINKSGSIDPSWVSKFHIPIKNNE